MKSVKFSCKFLVMVFTTLPLAMCTTDDTLTSQEESAKLVELESVRSMSPHNACNGFTLNKVINDTWIEENYPNVNLTLGSAGSNSRILGEFGASDADSELEFRMVIARKKTIDKNKESFSNVIYRSDGRYNVLDAVMTQTDYYFYKKGGGTLFITQDKKYKTERYTFGNRYVEGFAFSSAAQFASDGNNPKGIIDKDERSIYFTEDDVFSADETQTIPMYLFVDYRMLIQLRFLIRNGARDVSFIGLDAVGTEVPINLTSDSDLIALSEEFESKNIETLIFTAKADYRIDYFRGIIFSNESDDSEIHYIEYKYGEPIYN